MATAQCFEDLQVWQDARKLVREIYKVTKTRLFRHDFSLRDQIVRAATSTMSNIAEGFERGTRKEFIHFLSIAKGSNGEVRSQLYLALDQDYVGRETFDQMRESTRALSRRLSKFISYLERFPNSSRTRRAKVSRDVNLQPATCNPMHDYRKPNQDLF